MSVFVIAVTDFDLRKTSSCKAIRRNLYYCNIVILLSFDYSLPYRLEVKTVKRFKLSEITNID